MKRDKKGRRERNNCAQGPFGMDFSSLQMKPPCPGACPTPTLFSPLPLWAPTTVTHISTKAQSQRSLWTLPLHPDWRLRTRLVVIAMLRCCHH